MIYPAFHAHVYYDEASRPKAVALREALAERFEVTLGRWRDEPVGPHPQPMYQVAFRSDQFAVVTEWLMTYRNGLTVLVHPRSGDDLRDHTEYALWMGRILPLNLKALK
jgi:DOPA 4,5-dioxygenase